MKKLTCKESGKKEKNIGKKSRERVIQQLLNIFSQSPIPTLISCKDGRFVKYNDAMAELTGYTHKEVPNIDAWMFRLYPNEEYRKKVNEIAKKSINKEIDIKREEFIITRKDGKQRHVAFSAYEILHGRKPTDLQVVKGEDITERKWAEEALRESEEKYRKVVENIYDIVYSSYADGTLYFVSPNILSITGYKPEEFIGHNPIEFIHPDDREHVLSDFEKTIKTGEEFPTIFRLSKKDGSYFFVEEFGKVVRKGDEIVGVTGVLRDITEHKQAEEKLKNYQLIVESAKDAIFFKDLESHYIFVNNKTAEAFGLPREKVIGKNDYEIMPNKEEARKNIEDDQLVFKTGKDREITKHMTGADGREYWFQAIKVPQFDDKGNIVGLVGIARDITDLKKVEEALIKSENKFRELAESIIDVFFAIDRNFTYTYWNKASERLTGISTEGALGKSIYDIFPDIKGTKVEKFYKDMLKKQKPGSIEYNYRIGNTDYVFEISVYPTRDGLSIFAKDITDRKHMEENLQKSESELREQKSALEQKNIALREIIAHIEVEKNKIRDDITNNVNELIFPILEKLKLNNSSNEYIDLLHHLLEALSSSFGSNITKMSFKLTPREIEISTMVECGLMNKEISRFLNISCNTIEKHRENIRKKLGIYNKNVNLRSFLKHLQS